MIPFLWVFHDFLKLLVLRWLLSFKLFSFKFKKKIGLWVLKWLLSFDLCNPTPTNSLIAQMFWVFIYMKPKPTHLPLLWVIMLWPSTLLTNALLLPGCFTSIVKVYIIIVSTPPLRHYKLLATLQICSSLLFHCLSLVEYNKFIIRCHLYF